MRRSRSGGRGSASLFSRASYFAFRASCFLS